MLTLLQLLQELELQPMRGAAAGKRRCIGTPGQHASPLTMYCNAIYFTALIRLFFATTGFILRHWLVVTKIAGCDILNFLVVVTDYADGFGSYINIYTAGKSGTALLLLRLAFLQNSLQGIAPLDV